MASGGGTGQENGKASVEPDLPLVYLSNDTLLATAKQQLLRVLKEVAPNTDIGMDDSVHFALLRMIDPPGGPRRGRGHARAPPRGESH